MWKPLAALAALFAFVQPAAAQPAFQKVRGEIVELAPGKITVRANTGEILKMRLVEDWSVQVMRPISLTEIPAGTFVGVIETPLDAKSGQAHTIHRFEPQVRMGDGQQPWDRPTGSTMTSGEIGGVEKSARGLEFDVALKAGKRRIVATDATQVIFIHNEGREHIRPGVQAFILAWHEADGGLRVDAVATGPEGSLPPL